MTHYPAAVSKKALAAGQFFICPILAFGHELRIMFCDCFHVVTEISRYLFGGAPAQKGVGCECVPLRMNVRLPMHSTVRIV